MADKKMRIVEIVLVLGTTIMLIVGLFVSHHLHQSRMAIKNGNLTEKLGGKKLK